MEFDSFIFTHIPKCGGSSFRRLIYESALASGLRPNQLHIPGEGGVSHDTNISQLDQKGFEKLKKDKLKVLADHSIYSPQLYQQLNFKKPFVYTIFRNPKERFISHYNFFYKKIGHGECKGMEIRELSEQKLISIIKSLANIQCAYILGIEHGFSQRNVIGERFEEIKERLTNEIHCFGILEHMNESMELLLSKKPTWLQLPKTFPEVNVNTSNKQKSTYGRVNNLFGNFNRYDNMLYNWVSQKFSDEKLK